MNDILTRQDVDFLVDAFYEQAVIHPDIAKYFTQVVIQNFDTHKVKICDFWDTLIFHGNSYKGNPMLVHLKMHAEQALTPSAFKTWLTLWEQTVVNNYQGVNAEAAVSKAKQIAALMQLKVENSKL